MVEHKEMKVLDTLSGLSIYPKNKMLEYWVTTRTTVTCKMNFALYPFDVQTCPFFVQSSNFVKEEMMYSSYFTYDEKSNRLQVTFSF